jgi:hypothetical protein
MRHVDRERVRRMILLENLGRVKSRMIFIEGRFDKAGQEVGREPWGRDVDAAFYTARFSQRSGQAGPLCLDTTSLIEARVAFLSDTRLSLCYWRRGSLTLCASGEGRIPSPRRN